MKTWVLLIIILGLTVLMVGGMGVLRNLDPAILLVWFAACLVGGYYLSKKVALVTMQVTLTPELLTIRSAKDGNERQIPLEDIASYFYQDFNNNKTFRLRLHSGKKVTLAHNGTLCPADDIAALATDFKAQATADAAGVASQPLPTQLLPAQPSPAQPSPVQPSPAQREKTLLERPVAALAADVAGVASQRLPIQREKTFFEKPLAYVIGWVLVAGLVYFSWYLYQNGVRDGKWGAVCMVYGNGLAYWGALFAARSKSNA